ncbi:MAG TPA: ribonuclease H-like domain-containing protein [Anaerolineales bacterium]|nr:ribonuclease H-like domain-containing protein [Anaerolineales bacterium]
MNLVYFDLESQKLFEEVGGRDASKLLLACGVTWSTARNDFAVYWERDAHALIAELKSADRVIGFNTIKFDYEVLKPYAPNENLRAIRSTDMLQDIYRTLNFRLSLDSIARATLGTTKTADGLKSVQWFRNGELERVAEYCKADVDITRRIYEFGRDNGFVYYYSKFDTQWNRNNPHVPARKSRIPVNWSD